MNCIEEKTKKIINSVTKAYLHDSKLSEDILKLDGMSSPYVRHFLNNIVDDDTEYLEIGSWKGSTIVSALYNNQYKYAYVIDNWSQFGGPQKEFNVNLEKYLPQQKINVINEDSFRVDFEKIKKINTFFYDGKHDEQSHFNILKKTYSCLDDVFIYIVDDWNWNNVKNDTLNGIAENNLKIKFCIELFSEKNKDIYGWWNGLSVFVLKK